MGRCLNETYVIEGVLGEGGVGRVYKARHKRISTKMYALKVLHAEHARDPHQLARFQREAEAAATLSHPNVVGVFDVGRTEDGYSYLACELLSGTDLDAHLDKQGKLDVHQAVAIALQICDALEAAHGQNIVHRDLKPQNVFLLNGADGSLPAQPVVKVLDFGLSRFLDRTDAQLTKTGVVMGSPAFMAPEQASGYRGDHRADIYGIGVILYCALTGRAPFSGETLAATLVAVMTDEAPRPRSLSPAIPQALELIIQRAMAKKPEHRYATVAELKGALEGVLEHGLTRADSQSGSQPSHLQTSVRGRMNSTILAANGDYQLRTSRPRLLLHLALGLFVCVALLTSAVSGLELFTGRFELTRLELVLMLAGVFGTLAMPLALALKRFRRSVWSNSARVVDILDRVRTPLLSGLVAYGLSALTLRFGDEVLSRFDEGGLFLPQPGLAWAGFTWIFFAIALLAAGAAFVTQRLRDASDQGWRRWIGIPVGGATMALSALILLAGLQWRMTNVANIEREAQRRANETTSGDSTGGERALQGPAAPALASDEELAQAIAGGEEELIPLSEKYPEDPRVLEPLVLEFASRATGFADAMAMSKRLVQLSPEKRDSEALGVIVKRAAQAPGQASELAFELMRKHLGAAGPDLLFELSDGNSKVAERAEQALQDEAMREQMSPALRIALDVRRADGCEQKAELLSRAAQLGDLRSSSRLAPLAKGTNTGCGRWKNQPCPAKCPEQAESIQEAVDRIRQREAGTKL